MCRAKHQDRMELLDVARTCTGDCENCGAIGFELDRLINDEVASRSGSNQNARGKTALSVQFKTDSLELE